MGNPLIVDVESYWDQELSLREMSTTEYNCDPRTRPYSISVTELDGSGDVAWFENIPELLRDYNYSERVVFAYNARFDLQSIAKHFALLPKAGICLMDLTCYRYPLTNKKVALQKIAAAFEWPAKVDGPASAKNLKGWTGERVYAELREEAEEYVRHDAWLGAKLLHHLLYDFDEAVPVDQWFSMYWAISQFIKPVLELDPTVMVSEIHRLTTLRQHAMQSCGLSIKELRSNGTFMEAINKLGVAVPMKTGGGKKPKPIPEFAKTDPFMQGGSLREDALGMLIRARLECNSSINITRAQSYLAVAKVNNRKWPVHVIASGAKTHRITGGDGAGGNPLNMQGGSPIRNGICAPRGYRLIGYDYDKFELGIARWIARDEPTKSQILQGIDSYSIFASGVFGVPADQIDKEDPRRKVGKEGELSAQYQVGADTLYNRMRAKGIETTIEVCRTLVHVFRNVSHPAVPAAWRVAQYMLETQWHQSHGNQINLPGEPVPQQGWRWPSGRLIVMRNLERTPTGLACFNGRPIENVPDHMYGGKVYQRFCQSMANEVIQEKKRRLTESGLRVCMEVYDELVLCVRERADYSDLFEEITHIATEPVDWWNDAPPLRIGKLEAVGRYGQCK